MFNKINSWGNHETYNYVISKHPFIKFFKDLFNTENLEELHLKSKDYNEVKDYLDLGHLNDRDTDLHKIFYNEIKTNNTFKKLYCLFIKDIYSHFFPEDEIIIYQSYPSVRFQFMESVVIPPHKDSDHLSNHPLGEKNFIIPITAMNKTRTIIIESEPDKKDFTPITLNPGELFFFNGNTCTHYNEKNKENKLRISLDFRIILLKDYLKYLNKNEIIASNPRDIFWGRKPKKMLAGGYYQITTKNESIENMINWFNNKDLIMQHRPTFEKEEAESVYKYMLEDTFLTEYKKTLELEKQICDYVGSKHCIMTTSCTCALILGLMTLDLKEGSEVIVPNYTMIATINAVKMLKLKPVIIDVDKETFTMNVKDIENAITDKTCCVIHVSLNNRHKDIHKIVELCNKRDILLMEDSAQSLGLKISGKNLGTFGKLGCFSLSTPKIISTGQGGFIVTDDDEINRKVRMIKNFGRRESGKDNFEIFGINLKFTDLQAVIGLEQLKKMNYRTGRMREIYNLYYENLKDYYEMRKPLDDDWFPWFVDIYTNNRDNIIDILKKHNIQTRKTYGEINKTEIYYSDKILPNSDYVSKHGLFLPSFITLTDVQILYICKILIALKQ
jgi:perosamine synthetase